MDFPADGCFDGEFLTQFPCKGLLGSFCLRLLLSSWEFLLHKFETVSAAALAYPTIIPSDWINAATTVSVVRCVPSRVQDVWHAKAPRHLSQGAAPACLRKFVADDGHATGFERGNVFPSRIAEYLIRLGAVSGGGPGEDDHVRLRGRDCIVSDASASSDRIFSAGDFHEFRNPGRGTDARVRPSFAIDAGFRLPPETGALPDIIKASAHFVDHPLGTSAAIRQTAKRANVILDAGKRAGIQREKIDSAVTVMRDTVSSMNGTDPTSNVGLRRIINRRYPFSSNRRLGAAFQRRQHPAPFAYANEFFVHAKRKQNRSNTGCERDDSLRRSFFADARSCSAIL